MSDNDPVAWMVQSDDGERWLCHNHPAAAKYGLRCVPLFDKPQPTLTDAEREAIAFFADIHADDDPPHEYAVILGKLLERLA